jgi:hypothetical protein
MITEIHNNRPSIETVVAEHQLQRMIELEPYILTLLEIAADPEPRDNRWISYEALKRLADPYVGWNARRAELQTHEQHDMLMSAFDRLLPEEAS